MADRSNITTAENDTPALRDSLPLLTPWGKEVQITPPNPSLVNANARRIRWSLNGPIETAISVTHDRAYDSEEIPEPCYQGCGGDNGTPIWHPIAHLPPIEPKVSALTLHVNPLDEWDYYWMENHEGHTGPDGTYKPAEVLYGPLPDPGEGEEGDTHLLRCYSEARPRGKGTWVVVQPTAGTFVTVHDFISTVHPYLMARRDEVL